MNTTTTLTAPAAPAAPAASAAARALAGRASTSCIAITALAAALEDQAEGCPVQAAIVAALLAVVEAHTVAEEAAL